MIQIFSSLISTVSTLISFLANTIYSLICLVINIPNYCLLIFNSINLLPSFLIPFMTAYISLIVVQYILNRKA